MDRRRLPLEQPSRRHTTTRVRLPVDLFGRCLGLTREGLIEQLLADADELCRDERPGFRRLGNALRNYLIGDARSLDHALGIATPRCSRNTPKVIAVRIAAREKESHHR